MRIGFVSLFPDFLRQGVGFSILARAAGMGAVAFDFANPRDFTTDKHRTVDDTSYGGGPGMVMKPEPIADAVDSLSPKPGAAIILLDAAAERWNQTRAQEFSQLSDIILIAGHYEGIDERVRYQVATHSFSIGDFVITGGELPSLIITDSIVRLLPGVLGDPESHEDDSHTEGLFGFPLYTKPPEFRGESVPEVLLSGNHAKIAEWRRQQSLRRTRELRPDLFLRADLTPLDLKLLEPDD